MLIKDLVKLDTQGTFISAVQLSDYDKPQENLGLVKSYIFANNAPDMHHGQSRAVGSTDLLDEIRLAYINSSPVNRFVVIANYGHGKSHLALVLANYFAKPHQSQEVQEVLGRIDYALQHNKPKAENFHDFKRQYDRFLVIRLRGDTPRSLREQFFPALKVALQEHPATKNADLPFWNQQAKQWLESKVEDKPAKQFLKEKFATDFPNLLQEVEENKQEAYEQYVQLFAHLNNGVAPNAEGNFSLREAVIWAVDTFCKNAKPLAGVVVLFDEFSQFIERYNQSKSIGDLQDMLQGIGDRRGQAMFLAFAQHDPDEVAERGAGGQSLQNIKRELGRIDRKYALYSLMESVLNAYLAQSEPMWERFLQENPRTKGGLYGVTTELVWDLYLNRYDKELRWTNDKFREVVTKGCFPLHPLTTAMLCHLKMQQGMDDDARTILRFVRQCFEYKQEESAMVDGRINWILPIALVDYFGSRLGKTQDYLAYENAVQNLEQVMGDKVTPVHRDILKALLLQAADGLNVKDKQQLELLSQLSGSSYDLTKQTLRELSMNNIIKFDSNLLLSSFWPVAANPKALEDKIRDQIKDKKFGDDELLALNDNLGSLVPGANSIEVNIDWGTPNDWAANTVVVSKEKFTSTYLQSLMKSYKSSYKWDEGLRGLVVWLIALDDADIQFFKLNTQQVLQEAFPGITPPPVLLVSPTLVSKTLADQFLRYQALEAIAKVKDDVKEIGQSAFDNEKERTQKALLKSLVAMLGDPQFASSQRKQDDLVVPQPYRAGITAMTFLSVQSVMKKLYELAYVNRPPEFFTDLNANPRKGSSPLRDAVKTVSKNLISDQVHKTIDGMTPVARDRVCKYYLVAKWHLLTPAYYIQEPENVLSLKRAWNHLDEQIKPDEKEVLVSSFLINLFNAPYGFDYNTATLLFTAWIGKHHKEIKLYANNKKVGLPYLESLIEQNSPQEFLSKICIQERLAIARSDASKVLVEGRQLVDKIRKGLPHDQSEAESTIAALRGIIDQEICPANEKTDFIDAIDTLKSALDAAQVYDQKAKKLLDDIAKEITVSQLLRLGDEIQKLAWGNLVLPTQPANTVIQEKLDQQLKKVVIQSCAQVEKLTRIESADSEKARLQDQKEKLHQKHLDDLVMLISDAEIKLDKRIKQLKAQAEEAARINQINAITSGADLSRLYEYRETLRLMEGGSADFEKKKSEKLSSIETAISQLESFADSVQILILEIGRNDVDSLYDRLLNKEGRFTRTKYEASLSQAKQKLSQIRSFYNEIRSMEGRIQSIRTMDDVEYIQQAIGELNKKYKELVTQKQNAEIEKLLADVETCAEGQASKTEQRINELAKEVEAASLSFKDARAKLNQFSGFLTPQLSARIDLLRSRVDEKESAYKIAAAEKEAQAKAAEIKRQEEESRIKQINSMKPSAGLMSLYAFLDDLKAMTDSSPTVTQVCEKRVDEIQREITYLENFVLTATKGINELSPEQANSRYGEISNKAWRFEGTDYEAQLDEAKQNLDMLRAFYSDITKLEALPIRTAEDSQSIRASIDQVTAKYGSKLGKVPKARLDNLRQDFEYREQESFSKTEKWLNELEIELPKASISDFKGKLGRVPAYITPELNARIEALQTQLKIKEAEYEAAKKEKETQDLIGRIEELFLSIPDTQKRQECLDRLKKIS